MWRVVAGLWLCWSVLSPGAWADYQGTPQTPVDLSELTSEFKQAVASLEGCHEAQGQVVCRHLTGDFTAAERGLLDAALVAHDSTIRQQRVNQRRARRQSIRAKLKAGQPLTEAEVNELIPD